MDLSHLGRHPYLFRALTIFRRSGACLVLHYWRILLLHSLYHTAIDMLIEMLRIPECFHADRAISSEITSVARTSCGGGKRFARVRRRLFHPMGSGKVTLKDISALESTRPFLRVRAETTNHLPAEMGECVADFIVQTRQAPGVILARHNWALVWSMSAMREHVGV